MIATEEQAHREWHINAGVPIWVGVCPWDSCGPDYSESDETPVPAPQPKIEMPFEDPWFGPWVPETLKETP